MAQNGGRTSRTGPSGAEWANIRDEFTKLYISEDWSLPRVKQHLEGRGFHATPRMYKKRVEQWRLDKNRKGPEMQWAWHMLEDRRRRGLLTEFVIRETVKSEAYIRQYYRRNPRPAPVADASTLVRPEGIRCRTPKPEPEPKLIPHLDPGLPVELRYLKEYCEDPFIKSRSWILLSDDKVDADGFSGEDVLFSSYRQFDPPGRLVGVVEAATQLLGKGDVMEADRVLGGMPQRLTGMISQEHPQLPASILLVLQSLQHPCWVHRRQQFLEKLLHAVTGTLPKAAPLRVLIVALINSVDAELWSQMFSYLIEFYARVGNGQQHPQCFDTRMSRAWLFVLQGLTLQAEAEYLAVLQDLLRMDVHVSNTRCLQAILGLVRSSMDQADIERATHRLWLVQCGIESGSKKNVEMRVECQRLALSIKINDQARASVPAVYQDVFQIKDDEQCLSRDHPVAALGRQSPGPRASAQI